MNAEELSSLLASNGYSTRIRGGEVQVEVCWFCSNAKYNLELNAEKAIAHCWACRRGDRLDSLLRQMIGLDVHLDVSRESRAAPIPPPDRQAQRTELALVPSVAVESACRYLESRGLDVEDQRRYEVAVCTAADSQFTGRIIFPVREFWSHHYMGIVARRYIGSDGPKYMNDCERRIAGLTQLNFRRSPFVVCEGIFDGIAIHRAGANAAILLGLSHPAFDAWADRVPRDSAILICLDGAASAEAVQLYEQAHRVHPQTYFVHLPPNLDPGVLSAEVLFALFVRAIVSKAVPAHLSSNRRTSPLQST